MKTSHDINWLAKRVRTGLALLFGCFALVMSGSLAQAQLSDGLVGYWPFDGDLEDKSESDPPAHGVGKLWDGGAVQDNPEALADFETTDLTFVEGKFGQGINLDGDEYVETPLDLESRFDFFDEDDPDNQTGFTVSAWFRVDEFTTSWQALIAKGEQQQWRIHRRNNTDSLTANGGSNDMPDGRNTFDEETDTNINDQEIHHIVLVSSADAQFMYVDGELEAENGPPQTTNRLNDMPMMIGQNPDTAGDRTWQGLIDDVAIWNRPLSADEVAEIYNGGDGTSILNALDPSDPNVAGSSTVSVGPLPIVDTDTEFEVKISNTGDTQALEVSGFTLAGDDADHFTVVESPTSIPAEGSGVVKLTFNGLQQLGTFNGTLTFTTNDPDADDQTRVVSLKVLVPNPDGPEAHYRFDETDVAAGAADSTVNGRLGTYDENGGSINLAAPGLDAASGTAFAVTPGGSMVAPAFPLADFTVSGWFRPDSLGDAGTNDLRTIFGQGEQTPEVALLEASGALHWFGEETILFSTDAGVIVAGETYHVAITYDSVAEQAAIILDGVEIASESVSLPTSDGDFYVGAYGAEGNLGFDGVIDDVQFYSRVLSLDPDISFIRSNPGEVLSPFATGEDPDSDSDGLSDKDELAIHMTDPLVADTDGDGLSDGDEVASSLNPLLADTDGDGFLDGADEAPLDPNIPDPNDFLVVHYDFNEGTGTEIGNMGSAGPGELTNAHGAAWVSAGAPDGSGYLNFLTEGAGADAQYVATGLEGADNPFAGEVDYTAMAWVRFDTATTGGNNDDKMIFGQVVADSVLHLGARGSAYKFGHWGNDTDGGTIAVDEWRHVAFRYQDGEQSIIVDGETVASSEQGALVVDAEIVIGSARATQDRDMSGDLDDVRIYSAGLSNTLIANIIAEAGDPDADSDGDGLRDGYELETFGNLDQTGDGDPDEDGLTNLEEIDASTDPTMADTDGDSVSDGEELADMTDPLIADTDGDGLTDGDEKTRGTTPTSRDSDGDGFSDGVEVASGYDPISADSPDSAVIAGLLDEVGDAVVRYDFDEGSGTDISNGGTGGPGVLTNPHAGAWVAEGGVNNSAYLNFTQDGATGNDSQYVDTGLDAGGINISEGPYTMEAWVRADTTLPGGNDEDGMIFGQLEADNVLHNGLRGGQFHIGHWGNDTSGGTVSVGQWQHVAFRFADGVQTIFVDGLEEAQGVDKGGVAVDGTIVIGATRGDQDRDFSGDLDNVRIYNGALTDLQISALSANGSPVDSGGGGGDRPVFISDVVKAAGAGGAISFNFADGTTYDVEYSTDLIEWSVIASDVTGVYTEADAGRNGGTSGYYRGVAR